MSDERLPIEVLDLRQAIFVEGRVLVHGQDEQTGRNYLMLEGTDAKVHFIQYTPEMEQARSRGELRANSFVRLRKLSVAAPTAGEAGWDVTKEHFAGLLARSTSGRIETTRACRSGAGIVHTGDDRQVGI